jgi:hypothetical protein
MLSEEQIKQALHASSVLPLGVANPHGPLGLEQLAEVVDRLSRPQNGTSRVERPVALPVETWQKLDDLARNFSQERSRPVTASDVAVAILKQAVCEREAAGG